MAQALPDISKESGWRTLIEDQESQPYMQTLRDFLQREERAGHGIFPPAAERYAALDLTPLGEVRAVILGQDPYHGPGQAHGLSFSVPDGVKPPPSLKNIYKELARSLGMTAPSHGNLTNWARQGVLLLNTTLTVRAHEAGSHAGKGWENFTDAIIRAVNDHTENVVFMLWGGHAQKKSALLQPDRHLILSAPHPSPLSAHRGFIGCDHFLQANDYLTMHGRTPIRWHDL